MTEQNIFIIGQCDSQAQSKGFLNQSQIKRGELSVETLKDNLSSFIEGMSETFEQMSISMQNYELDEIEVKVDISVTGGVSLVGSVEAGTTGGITLKFKRIQRNE